MRWRSSPFRGRFLTRGEFQSEICRDAGGSDVVILYILVLFNVFRTENCFLQVSSYIKHKSQILQRTSRGLRFCADWNTSLKRYSFLLAPVIFCHFKYSLHYCTGR